jgi:hypothetical protein
MVIGFILIPFGMMVLSAPTWVERQTAARDAAAEAARLLVVSDGNGSTTAAEVIRRIEDGYGLPVGTLVASVPTDRLMPGGTVTVTVTVEVPALSLPILGAVGSVDWTAEHTERVPDYGAGR